MESAELRQCFPKAVEDVYREKTCSRSQVSPKSRHSVCEKGARGIQTTAKKFQELSFGGLKGLLKGGSLGKCSVL